MGDIPGIDIPKVTAWFEANIADVKAPLEFALIAGGRSNLTFKVTDAAGSTFVLRRPPISHVLATAHDMGREHKIISALADSDVPVPPALGLCADAEVNGAPFYVMGFIDGYILRDPKLTQRVLDEDHRRQAGESLIDVLGEIHAVDPDAVGLGDLGRKEAYLERQLKRWHTQFEAAKSRDIPEMDEMHAFFVEHMPTQQTAAIVHGDYRLDNTMLSGEGQVLAVLDWELCTLGDPMADLGLLMVYWNDPNDSNAALASSTALPGFPRRAELIERYASKSSLDLTQLDYYVAFGYWKLASIMEGVYARYAAGAMGGDRTGTDGMGQQVVNLAKQSKAAAARLG